LVGQNYDQPGSLNQIAEESMSEHVAHLDRVPTRFRALIVPREHGAWGMLLVPLVIGAAVGVSSATPIGPLVTFTTSALLLFWLRTPVESWLGTTPMRAQTGQERRFVLAVVVLLATITSILLGSLFWNGENLDLLLVGAAAGAAFGTQAIIKKFGRRMRMPAQIIGALGLSSCAAAAYYVVTGDFGARAIALWLASWLFAADQIHFVQLRIQNGRMVGLARRLRRGFGFLVAQTIMLVVVVLLCRYGIFPRLAVVAFIPVLIRGLAWFAEKPRPLSVKRLGWTELAHAITFGVLLTAIFRLG
jgi:hypothetical protein